MSVEKYLQSAAGARGIERGTAVYVNGLVGIILDGDPGPGNELYVKWVHYHDHDTTWADGRGLMVGKAFWYQSKQVLGWDDETFGAIFRI